MKKKTKNKTNLKLRTLLATIALIFMRANVYASSISTAEVQTATENIKTAIVKLAMPVGSILMFVSIVIIALKMIANSGNPNKRTESIGSLAWVARRFYVIRLSPNCKWNCPFYRN